MGAREVDLPEHDERGDDKNNVSGKVNCRQKAKREPTSVPRKAEKLVHTNNPNDSPYICARRRRDAIVEIEVPPRSTSASEGRNKEACKVEKKKNDDENEGPLPVRVAREEYSSNRQRHTDSREPGNRCFEPSTQDEQILVNPPNFREI